LIQKNNGIAGGSLPFTNADIRQMLESTKKFRTKALIHFIASTGIRPGAIIDPILRKKHLIEISNECLTIRVYDNSTEGYWAFLTPEAKKYLYQYFTARKINGETLTDESPMFVNEYDKFGDKECRTKFSHLTLENLSTIMDDVVNHAGIPRTKTGNRYDKAVVYGFRKRLNTVLKNNNHVNSNIAEKLMAHKRGLDGVYFVPTREECFREFESSRIVR
jgi:integrase/recombinase XerD